ncbi:MAG: Hsp20/alpha crystallin family protein [Anaerolineae bacterium]|nr:Hsp20/alpha crystallin family protein [Anaerolineae bacterium]
MRSDEGWEEEPRQAAYRLPLDVHSTSDEIVLAASVPGLTPDKIGIAIDGERLTIEGELRAPSENVDYMFRERPYGKFTRGLTLNVPIDIEKAEAEFENGVLTIILPRLRTKAQSDQGVYRLIRLTVRSSHARQVLRILPRFCYICPHRGAPVCYSLAFHWLAARSPE